MSVTVRPARCPACEGSSFAERRVLADLLTRTCISCGLVLSDIHRSGPVVPEFALVNEQAYLRSVGETRRIQAEIILGGVRKRIAPGASLLDVGCSFGFFLLAARRAGFDVTGIEPDPNAYASACELLGGDTVRPGLFGPGLVPRGSFDVVTTLDVVEHIPADEHEAFADAVGGALTANGLWVIKVPSTEGLYYRSADVAVRLWPQAGATLVRRLWQTRYEFPHLVYFSLASLRIWLRRFGFRDVAHAYIQEVPTRTVVQRLTTDGDIGRAKALLAVPAVFGVNVVEALRRRSDSLVVIADRHGETTASPWRG